MRIASSKSLKYKADQEHIVRRIGASMIVHWDELPDALQDSLIDQAVLMEDLAADAPSRAEVESFIRKVIVREAKAVAAA